jgi:hypothetical protein
VIKGEPCVLSHPWLCVGDRPVLIAMADRGTGVENESAAKASGSRDLVAATDVLAKGDPRRQIHRAGPLAAGRLLLR